MNFYSIIYAGSEKKIFKAYSKVMEAVGKKFRIYKFVKSEIMV